MAFDEELIKGILENAETAVEDKIKLILSEHEADERGLLENRNALKGEKEALEEKLKAAGEEVQNHITKIVETEKRASALEEELKKNDPEERQKWYENQITSVKTDYETRLKEANEEAAHFKQSHLSHLRDKAIEDALKDIPVREGLKRGFVAAVLSSHKFEPKDDLKNDGTIRFVDKELKEIKDVLHEFSLSQEGREYLRNTSTGGGAPGSQSTRTSSKNPWSKKTLNLTEQAVILKENPGLAKQLQVEASNEVTT
jgi:hypothetical protein